MTVQVEQVLIRSL